MCACVGVCIRAHVGGLCNVNGGVCAGGCVCGYSEKVWMVVVVARINNKNAKLII